MSNHLSHDQMSRCVLGQASRQDEAHGRICSQCKAELIQFTDAVATFQDVMKEWSEREAVPRFEETPSPMPLRRWLVAGVAVAVLVAIPIYEQRERQPRPESKANADELLMEEVAAHLSRPLPMSMERVMVLLPQVESNVPEREEVR